MPTRPRRTFVGRRNKFGAKRTYYHAGRLHSVCPEPLRETCKVCATYKTIPSYWFDSKAEAEYAQWLDAGVRDGSIVWWERGWSIPLLDADKRADRITYKPDFWVVPRDGLFNSYFVDVKGVITREFKRTVKLWKSRYPDYELRTVQNGKSAVVAERRPLGSLRADLQTANPPGQDGSPGVPGASIPEGSVCYRQGWLPGPGESVQEVSETDSLPTV